MARRADQLAGQFQGEPQASIADKTAQVAGKVTYQGRTVIHGSVILLVADNKARSGVIGQPSPVIRT